MSDIEQDVGSGSCSGDEQDPASAADGASQRGRQLQKGTSGRGRGRGGTRGGGRKPNIAEGKKQCSMCGKVKPVMEFGLNQPRRTSPCRHAYDSLRAAAVAQNQLEWFEEQMADPNKRMKLLHNYENQRIS